jgi:inosose dehydratase
MTVQLGINPITWTNDDMPELGGDIPLETCLAETREAGYSGTELGGKFPAHPRPCGRSWAASSEAGIRLVRWPHPRARRGRGVRCHRTTSDAAADLGCRHVVYADTSGGMAFRRSRSARRWRTATGRPMAAR